MQYSSNYKLKLMEGTDTVKRQDFVDNFTTIDTTLGNKAEKSHNHDDRYYTESEIDGKINTINNNINGKANTSHNHDDRYYTESEINSKLNEKVNGKNRIITNSNLSVLGLTFPVTCETLANAMSNGDVLFCDSYIISDAPTSYGHLFVMRENENRIEFQYRNCGQDANGKTYNELYIGSYRNLSSTKWSGWLLVSSDSGWINLPLANGTTNGRTLQFRNLNGRIQMRGSFQKLASSKIIGTLPVGFRPTYKSYFPVCLTSDLYNVIAIETNGTISSFRPASDIGNYTVDLDVISFLNT